MRPVLPAAAAAAITMAAALCVSATAHAQPPRPEIAFAGLVSPDLPAAELAEAEGAIEQVLNRQTRVREKGATLAAIAESEGIANTLALARGAAVSGGEALDAFNLPRALEELGRALSLYDSAMGDRLVPVEVGKVLERRAQVFYALRRPADMRSDFARMIELQPGRSLDERVFAPDAMAAFEEVAAQARVATPAPAKPETLAEIAKRAGVRFALVGEARSADGGDVELYLTMASVTGAVSMQRVRVPRAAPATGLDRGLAPMLETLAVPRREAIAVIPPKRPPPERPRERERRPVYAQWWFWGGVVAAGAAAAYAGSEALDRPRGGGGSEDPPPDPGVTITFEERQ